MFTALILICAGGVKDPSSCYYQANEAFFEDRKVCEAVILDSIRSFPELFEWYDENLQVTWMSVKV